MNIRTFLLVVAMICFTTVSAQDTTERTTYGGITFDEKYQKVLDQANVGITYKYTFAISKDDGTISSLRDTLLLAIGDTYSVFFNPMHRELMESQRQGRIARSRKATAHAIEDDLNSIVGLIKENSDYSEDDPGDPVQVFKNRSTGEVSSVYNSYIANVRHDQVIEEMNNWEITAETDSIMGYLCHRATLEYGGRVYDVWFTLDLPINDGPWKLWGLPGIILKATDKDCLFKWDAIGIQNLDGEIVIDDRDYEEATLSQFSNFVDKSTSSFIVEFFNNGTLYHSEKKRGYNRIPHEIK
ncbi:GLPGLI family protein [Porphyromonas levii]|uniref:GLPGLI family protein n=1 Tax=Porphyromonas levii TaxID=28114 RepID=UPI000380C5DF|nr:GLPGLI family protein [Porphyromonas levii]